jgi:glycosyltransferase involved in cell wall biosynthesis
MDKLVFGASPVIARGEVDGLRRLGINASLLLIKRGVERNSSELGKIPTEFLEDQSSFLSKRGLKVPGFNFFSTFHLFSPILAMKFKVPYDLLITHGTYTCFTALTLKRTKGIPYLAYIYDPITYILPKVYSGESLGSLLPILVTLGRELDKMIVNSSEAVILLSKYHLNSVRQLTSKPVHVVYPGTEVPESIPSERGRYLLAVARWERKKYPFLLLDVLKALKRDGVSVRLLVEGDWKPPTLRTEFLKRIKQEGLQEQISMCGPSKRPDLLRFYSEARALIVPDVPSFGMIPLEAAAHGCPIIIPKRAGVTDLFADGIHGFFPDEGDVDGFATSIKNLVANERLAWKMGHEAWNVAIEHTWDNHARTLAAVLERYPTSVNRDLDT